MVSFASQNFVTKGKKIKKTKKKMKGNCKRFFRVYTVQFVRSSLAITEINCILLCLFSQPQIPGNFPLNLALGHHTNHQPHQMLCQVCQTSKFCSFAMITQCFFLAVGWSIGCPCPNERDGRTAPSSPFKQSEITSQRRPDTW